MGKRERRAKEKGKESERESEGRERKRKKRKKWPTHVTMFCEADTQTKQTIRETDCPSVSSGGQVTMSGEIDIP